MKKVLKSLFLLSSFILLSCSSNDDETSTVVNTNQFKVDGQFYSLLPVSSVVDLRMNDMNIENNIYDRSSITINGLNGSNIAVATFDLYYKDGLPLTGTYNIDDTLNSDSDFYENLHLSQKLCLGWTSMCNVTQAGNSSSLINANNPTGTVTVTNNGNNNYTIKYDGYYKKYNNDFQIIGTIPVKIDITTNVLVQNN